MSAEPESPAAAKNQTNQPARRSDGAEIAPGAAGRVQPRPGIGTAITADVGGDGARLRPDEPESPTAV